MGTTQHRGATQRLVAANPQVRRFVLAHLLAVIAEYAVVVGTLVYAFERGGAGATGLASVAILLPAVAGGPLAVVLTGRFRAGVVRRVGLGVQIAAYGLAAVAVAVELPVAVVVGAMVIGLGAVCTLRPAGAALLPAIVRSSSELTAGGLWISYCESASALAGPLLAGALLAVGGPAWVLAGGALAVVGALGAATFGADDGPHPGGAEDVSIGPVLRAAVEIVRSRPAIGAVLAVVLARYVVLGALDVLLVVLALDVMDLSSAGAGLLNALLGVGAVASAAVVTVVARRGRLAPGLAIGLGASVLACIALGSWATLPVAVVALPVLGVGVTVIDGLGRMLLQRSAEPRQLGPLFAVVELVAGVGMVLGSLVAQGLIRIAGADVALLGLAMLLVVILAVSGRAAWRADATADVPVVEMSLLRSLPMFAPLGPVPLEVLARTARHRSVAAGEVVMTQGAPGDTFYAVADGELDVVMSGEHIRIAGRGGFVGEVALLADVPRTATVSARRRSELLEVDRVAFLVAVTGSDTSHAAAWGVVRSLRLETDLPPPDARSVLDLP